LALADPTVSRSPRWFARRSARPFHDHEDSLVSWHQKVFVTRKVFVIMALPARAAARIKRRTARTRVSGPLTD
jgi:hypothetical protein